MTTPTPRTDAEFIGELEEMAQRVTSKHNDYYATKTIREAAVHFHNISRELTAKTAELEEANALLVSVVEEVKVYRKCDGVMDGYPPATDEPLYIQLERMIKYIDELRSKLREARATAFEEAADDLRKKQAP